MADKNTKGDLGAAEVEANVQAEQDKGYRGEAVDPTPNSNYTVAGVTSGKPTPETDPKQAAKARDAQAERAAALSE